MKLYDLEEKTAFSGEGPVKRHFLNSNGFHAALICLKKGVEIPPHPEDYAVFLLVLEGEGVFTNGEDSALRGKGQGAYIKKDEVRGIKAEEDLTILGIQDRAKGGNENGG